MRLSGISGIIMAEVGDPWKRRLKGNKGLSVIQHLMRDNAFGNSLKNIARSLT